MLINVEKNRFCTHQEKNGHENVPEPAGKNGVSHAGQYHPWADDVRVDSFVVPFFVDVYTECIHAVFG
jgi:hypothetical protein